MFIISFISWSPLISILVFSAIITFISTLLYKKLINYNKYKEINEKQKELRKQLKEIKEPKKMMEMQNEMMKLSMESLKLSFKPMIVTFVPFLLIFLLLKKGYAAAGVGNIISWGSKLPVVETGGGWFFFYVIFSLIFSLIFRKLLKL